MAHTCTFRSSQMTWQPAPSIRLPSHPSLWRRPASCQSIPGCCPPSLFLSASSSPYLYCALQDCLDQPIDLVTCPYYFSVRLFTVVKRSPCGPMACRVLFRTSSLEMCLCSVGDADELSEASHPHGMYPSLCVCC